MKLNRHVKHASPPSTLYNQVVQHLKARIVDRHLQPGDKLPNELELAKEYGVSRSVVREVIRTLSQEGLVEVRRGVGTFIIDGTTAALKQSFSLALTLGESKDLSEVVEIRIILEPEIAAIAALRATDRDIADMREAVAVMDCNLDSPSIFVSADLEFHLALARATQNSLIPTLLDPIMDLLTRMRRSTYRIDQSAQRGQQHHKDILDAIVHHDVTAARNSMKLHLQQIRSDYTQFMQEHRNKPNL